MSIQAQEPEPEPQEKKPQKEKPQEKKPQRKKPQRKKRQKKKTNRAYLATPTALAVIFVAIAVWLGYSKFMDPLKQVNGFILMAALIGAGFSCISQFLDMWKSKSGFSSSMVIALAGGLLSLVAALLQFILMIFGLA